VCHKVPVSLVWCIRRIEKLVALSTKDGVNAT
jgi:hypothetical protein